MSIASSGVKTDAAPHTEPVSGTSRFTILGLPGSDFATLLVTMLIWSSLHPIGKRTLEEITGPQLPFTRVALAAIFLIAVCAVTGRLGRFLALFRPREVWKVVILGTTGFSLSSGLSMMALGYLPAGLNSVLANASPLMVALGMMVVLRERLPHRTVIGLLVGFCGVAVIALRGGIDAGSLNPLGVTMSLVSSATWALYTVIARRLTAGHDAIAMSAATSAIGALPLAVVVAVEGEIGRLVGASTTTLLLLLWCGVVATGATFTMWVVMLRRVHAARVASFQYLIPLSALALAYPIAGEVPTVTALLGAAMIVSGVAVANSAVAGRGARRG
ncbi:MAG: DMT family transporter [Chloroflexota bacterium]